MRGAGLRRGEGAAAALAAALVLILSSAGSAPAADLAAVRAKAAEPCTGCHGEAGISQIEGTPSLAAQPDRFTQWQLVYFRSGTRKNEVMEQVASGMSDADIRGLGAYFASLAPPPPVSADDKPELTKHGAEIAAQRNCASCHTDSFAGQQAIARLAGQREEYLVKALDDFRANARAGSGVAAMADAAYGLGDDDITALAHYLARVH